MGNNTDGQQTDQLGQIKPQIILTTPGQSVCPLVIEQPVTRCRSESFEETRQSRESAFDRFISDKKLRVDMCVPGVDERVAGPYKSKTDDVEAVAPIGKGGKRKKKKKGKRKRRVRRKSSVAARRKSRTAK